jgi:hypothetical protein
MVSLQFFPLFAQSLGKILRDEALPQLLCGLDPRLLEHRAQLILGLI